VANLLLGNPADAALLEMTLGGPRLHFRKPARIAWTGGDIDAHCDGTALPGWRPLEGPADAAVQFGAVRRGCRSYLAIAGGWQVPTLLDSRSTDVRAGFGGIDGRPLRAGDMLHAAVLPTARRNRLRVARWWVDP